jgi:hypothetical protein
MAASLTERSLCVLEFAWCNCCGGSTRVSTAIWTSWSLMKLQTFVFQMIVTSCISVSICENTVLQNTLIIYTHSLYCNLHQDLQNEVFHNIIKAAGNIITWHVHVSVAVLSCFTQSYPVNDWRVIQFIREHGILLCEQSFKYSSICIKTAWIKNSVFTLVKVGNFTLQLL